MNLVNSILIQRTPAIVWGFLENPEKMLLWNPNVKQVTPSVFSDPKQGYRYDVTYKLLRSSDEFEFQAEFVHFEPLKKLVIRHTERIATPLNRVIVETYELAERVGGTQVTQSIDVTNPGVNIFLRTLLWILLKSAEPTSNFYLEALRNSILNGTEPDAV